MTDQQNRRTFSEGGCRVVIEARQDGRSSLWRASVARFDDRADGFHGAISGLQMRAMGMTAHGETDAEALYALEHDVRATIAAAIK